MFSWSVRRAVHDEFFHFKWDVLNVTLQRKTEH